MLMCKATCKMVSNMQLHGYSIIKTNNQTCPSSYQVPPDSRWETGLVGISSDGAVTDGSPSWASRAVLMGM